MCAANGTWYFIVDIGYGTDRRQTRRRGFATKREAQAEFTRILTSVEGGIRVAPQRTSVADFLQTTWLPTVEHTIKPGTFESHRRNVRLHIAGRPLGRRLLQDVGPADLNALYRDLLAGDDQHRKLSPRSVAYIAATLHRALRDAVRWQGITRALKAHRKRQREERLVLGANYQDEDLVICQPDGTPIHPKTISYQFGKAARAAALPKVRLHDLRHTHATLALLAGVHPRVVQERLGHANVSITLDTYSHVDLDLHAAAAAQVAALLTAPDPDEPGLPKIL